MDDTIGQFMTPGPIAVVGASDSARSFGGTIYRTLKMRGYRVYAVHPAKAALYGDPCYASVADLPAEVESAVIAVRPEKAMPIVEEAVARGVKRLWFQQGADFSEAARRAREAGIVVVTGRCILLYASPVTGLHKFHQLLARFFGRY